MARRIAAERVVGLVRGRMEFAPRSDLPAITDVDHSARVQSVSKATQPRFHALLTAFEALTGRPVLIDTGFKVRDEPIVCTPEDACRCFMRSAIDDLVLGDLLLEKELQPKSMEDGNRRQEFILD